jgi:beta-N-acetylhexosaminidase
MLRKYMKKIISIEEKIGKLFICSPDELGAAGITCDDEVRRTLKEFSVLGFILFYEGIPTRSASNELISNLQAAGGGRLWMTIDEEGGVQTHAARVEPSIKMPSMATYAAHGDVEAYYGDMRRTAIMLREMGFHINWAPVCDLNTNPENPIIGDRAFGSDPELASKFIEAGVKAMKAAGIISCLKHFPGHGDTKEDSHKGSATVNHTMARFHEVELVPFRAGIAAGAEMVMMGHIHTPKASEDELPATFSRFWCKDILRDTLGFEGVIVSDALNMKAISAFHAPGEAAVLALEAGCDILLMPTDLRLAHQGVLEAVNSGRIKESRIDEALGYINKFKLDLFGE